MFPIDEAILISGTALAQIQKYVNHPFAGKIAVSLRHNLCLLLLKNGRYAETIMRIDELIPAAKEEAPTDTCPSAISGKVLP